MERTGMTESERMIAIREVNPDRLSHLFNVLQLRGTFDDDTTIEPETGRTDPEVIIAISKATQSALLYEDGYLTYLEGRDTHRNDEHWGIFQDATSSDITMSGDPRAHETV